jgi:uncharacterized membrane protein (DUF4010 family)
LHNFIKKISYNFLKGEKMEIEFLKSLLLSAVLGFLIGLERNISFKSQKEKGFAGSRTFSIISMLGFLSAYLSQKFEYFIYLSFFGVICLSAIAYFLKVFHYHRQGTTTHFSVFVAFIVGMLVSLHLYSYAIAITVITVFILNLKTFLENVESKLSREDINAAILLIAMSVLVLPYLPDKMIYFINPYKTWLMAVIIASLHFLGYIAIKLIGEKYGILLLGAAGGFASSTAVTYSISKLYAKIKNTSAVYTYAAAIAIANTIMFARVFIEVFLVNKQLATLLALPYILTTAVGIFMAVRLYKKSPNEVKTPSIINKNPLELEEAVKFALIFAVIYGATYYISSKYGNIGVYIISFISGLTDVDAITLSLSSLSKQDLSLISAGMGIAIASVSNSLFKLSLVWIFGKKDLAKILTRFFAVLLGFFILTFSLTVFIKVYAYAS